MQYIHGLHMHRCHDFVNRVFRRSSRGFSGWFHELNGRVSARCASNCANAVPVHARQHWYKSITCWSQSNRVTIGLRTTSELLPRRNLSAITSTDDKEQHQFTSQWDAMFQQLKEYKAKHGDTLVPATYPENPSLGNWVDNNRQAYRMRFEYENNSPVGDAKNPTSKWRSFIMMMTDEKIEALESIGFVWNVLDHVWNTRYEELMQYIEEHGNALVPTVYPENEQLGLWVHKQRRNYKVYKQQCKVKNPSSAAETSLSPERVQKLNDAGFVWDVHEAAWLERLKDLVKYKRDNGDTLVPRSYPILGKWVEKQRADYKKYIAKKKLDTDDSLSNTLSKDEIDAIINYKSGMNEERIRLLEAEDFIWDPLEYAWQTKYDELCQWIALNGHGAIRRGKKNYSPLEGWAENQRRLYKKYLNGEVTSLTEERIKKLNRAGFAFFIEKSNSRVKNLFSGTKKKKMDSSHDT